MYKAEKEIFSQYEALEKSYSYLEGRKAELSSFFEKGGYSSITFIGCGSSYSLCKSAELSTRLRCGTRTYAFAAGDIMMNFPFYEKLLKNTLLVVPSRSGSTSEVINAVKTLKGSAGAKCISISTVKGSSLSAISELSIEMPWAFDESVCQTRTVTNLYMADLFLAGIIGHDEKLLSEIGKAVKAGKAYIEGVREKLREIGEKPWESTVVLADGELEGIAEEGALAFKEICQKQSNYYHILDVRHGPAVLITERTLVIAAASPYGANYQEDLLKEFAGKGATVITVGTAAENTGISQYHIELPEFENYAVRGVPFIFVPQAVTLSKALSQGINPDEPTGLSAWIKL